MFNKPYYVYIGGDWSESLSSRNLFEKIIKSSKLLLEQYVVGRSKHTLVRGSRLERRFEYWKEKISQAVSTVDLDFHSIPYRKNHHIDRPAKCLFVGSISTNKGILDLMSAVENLEKQYDEKISLKLIGHQHNVDISMLINKYKLESCIEYLGYVPNGSDLYKHYMEADIFILPSLSEGFPRVLLEAMYFGLAIITTSVGGISDLMVNEYNCLIVNIRSPHEISSSIIRLIYENGLSTDLVQNGYRTIHSLPDYSAATQIKKLFGNIKNS